MASLTLLLPQILFVCLFVPSLARGWIVWLAACLSQMNGYEWLAGWMVFTMVGWLFEFSLVRSLVYWYGSGGVGWCFACVRVSQLINQAHSCMLRNFFQKVQSVV